VWGFRFFKFGFSRVFQVWVLAGFLSEFAVLVGGLLLYWANRGVEAATITIMEGYDLPESGRASERGGKHINLIVEREKNDK
jgi:hypothetical protein